MTDQSLEWKERECPSLGHDCGRHQSAWVKNEASIDLCFCGDEDGQDVWLVTVTVWHHPPFRFPRFVTEAVRDTAGSLDDAKKEASLAYWQVVEVLGLDPNRFDQER